MKELGVFVLRRSKTIIHRISTFYKKSVVLMFYFEDLRIGKETTK